MNYKYLLKTKENKNFEYEIHEIICKKDLPETEVLTLCNKIYPQYNFVECKQLNSSRHICKYCGWVAEGVDEDLLCTECRTDFGHAFFSDL